ncbi:hypothetical protein Lalb_Chr02g0157981 [Lupinus albus]|uniref:Uncharacterized protein n=1 Tax=Lupinus albus TaxID=3870 RepID=A0A6A4R2C5_LUPAL|nr:hypothetical protein Lalb_Chr02g0157981 [Lupinus albus]
MQLHILGLIGIKLLFNPFFCPQVERGGYNEGSQFVSARKYNIGNTRLKNNVNVLS